MNPHAASPGSVDLDTTDQLPVLDPAAIRELEQRGDFTGTDTWLLPVVKAAPAPLSPAAAPSVPVLPVAPVAAGRAVAAGLSPIESSLTAIAGSLRETRQQLASRTDRLGELEKEHEALRASHSAAQARSAELLRELEQARALLEAANGRGAQLQTALDEELNRGRQHDDALRQQRALMEREQASSAGLDHSLQQERARGLRLLEALQNAEARRHLAAHALMDARHEADGQQSQVARLSGEVTQREERLRARDGELAATRQQLESLQTLSTGHQQRVRELEAEHERLRGEHAALRAEFAAARAAVDATVAQQQDHEKQLAREREHAATLEKDLITQRQRTREAEEELGAARAEMERWAGVLRDVQGERTSRDSERAAAAQRVQDLEQRASQQQQALEALQGESAATLARARELEGDLRAAEEAVHRLESEVRGHDEQVQALQRESEHWRAQASGRHAVAELRQAAAVPIGESALVSALPEGTARLLIGTQGGSEVARLLGRRTTIGRTPDNDMQIEASYISRHHAVILAGPTHTYIEDLNSTNGVMVNGQRITRAALADGDRVTIGRTTFRFVVRQSGG